MEAHKTKRPCSPSRDRLVPARDKVTRPPSEEGVAEWGARSKSAFGFPNLVRALKRRYRAAEREVLLAGKDEDRYCNARNALLALRQEILANFSECAWLPRNLGPETIVSAWLNAMRRAVDGTGNGTVLRFPLQVEEKEVA